MVELITCLLSISLCLYVLTDWNILSQKDEIMDDWTAFDGGGRILHQRPLNLTTGHHRCHHRAPWKPLSTKSVHRNCFRNCVLQHRPLLIGFHAVIRFTHTIVSIPGWSWCCVGVKSCGVSGLYPILLFWPPEASGGWAVFHQTYLNKSLWDNTPLKFKDKNIRFVLSFNSWNLANLVFISEAKLIHIMCQRK